MKPQGIYWFREEAHMRDWYANTPSRPAFVSAMYRLNDKRKSPDEPAAIRILP